MKESYLDLYLSLILEITEVLSSRKLLLYSIKTNKTQRKVFLPIRSAVVLFAHFGIMCCHF